MLLRTTAGPRVDRTGRRESAPPFAHMTAPHDSSHDVRHDVRHDSRQRPLSRRRLLLGAAAGIGAGAVALDRLGAPLASAIDPELLALDEPGTALHVADRLGAPPRAPLSNPIDTGEIEPPPPGMLMFPVDPASDCYVLDNFGDARGTSRLHVGVDILGSRFQPIYAVADGELVDWYTNTGTAGYGWKLYDAATDTTYKYFHCEPDQNGLVVGDRVRQGDVIAFVGKSGTTGVDNYHLHFEVRPGDVPVDPLPLMVVDRDACGVSAPLRA